jgi:hypothetical protein
VLILAQESEMIMAIEELESFPAEENPFWHDHYHMGSDLDNDWLVMYENFQDNKYFIFCNKKTGERFKIYLEGRIFSSQYKKTGDIPVVKHEKDAMHLGLDSLRQ